MNSINQITKFLSIVVFFIFSCDSSEETNNQNVSKESIVETVNPKDTLSQNSKEEWNWDWHSPDIWSNYPIDKSLVYSFEDAFKVASELKILYINEPNKRENLPKEIVQLQELEELWLWVNITDVEGVFDLLKELPKLKKLSIRQLKYIPSNIDQLSNLEALELQVGSFKEVNESLCNMTKLRYIRLYNSRKLKELPVCIENLIDLEYLDIAGTSISELSKGLSHCKKLRTITANACKINYIDESICNLPILSHFNLGANRIEVLPEKFGNLTNLDALYLGSNRLSNLPKSIKNMSKLQHIHIDNNKFEKFPLEIFGVNSFYSLWIHENEIGNIPVELISKSNLQRILIDLPEINKEEISQLRKLKPNLKIINQ